MSFPVITGTYWGVKGGRSCCGYGMACSIAQKPHAGDDVCAPQGAEILALADGVVYRSRNGGVSGYHQEITIKYDVRHVSKYVDYVYVLYGHLLKDSLLAVGAVVRRGKRIGRVGTRADAMGTPEHTHVEMWADEPSARNYVNWRAINPRYIREALEPMVKGQSLERKPSGGQLLPLGRVPKAVAEPATDWHPAYRDNFGVANRTAKDVYYIVLHQTQSAQGDQGHGDASWFADPRAGTSAHYIVGDSGHISKCVKVRDIAYHAGNWDINRASVAIEIDGFTNSPDTSALQYQGVAKLLRFLHGYFEVPMQLGFDTSNPRRRVIQRAGIIGHEHVPGADHTDPGTGLDYSKALTLARAL